MNRTAAFLAVTTLTVTLAGCGGSDDAATTATVTVTAEASAPAETADSETAPEAAATTTEDVAAPSESDVPESTEAAPVDSGDGPLAFGTPASGERWEVTVAKPVETPAPAGGSDLCPTAKSFVVVNLTWKNIQKGVSVSPMEDADSPTFSGKAESLCTAGELNSSNDSMTAVLPGRQIVVRQVVGLPEGEKAADVAVTLGGVSWSN